MSVLLLLIHHIIAKQISIVENPRWYGQNVSNTNVSVTIITLLFSIFIVSAGVPDTPQLQIDGGTASWNAVNPRTENPRVSYNLEIIGPEGEIAQTLDVDSRLSEDLTNLDLEVGQSYNVCITAINDIGRSAQSCVPYVHNPPPG